MAAAIGWRFGARRAAGSAPLDRYLPDAVRDIPYGMAIFDAEDRLVFCNDLHRSINPRAHHLMVPGRTFEEILRGASALGCHALDGQDCETMLANRIAAHKDPQNKPFLQHMSDGRWIQIKETRTGLGGTLTTWNDVTPLKLREQALAILAERNTNGRSALETAAQALAAGLGCRVAGIAQHLGDGRACLQVLWDGGLTGESQEYDLEGAPCAELARGKDYCHFPDNITELFPNSEILRQMRASSFIGHVIRNHDGHVTGHILALDDRPMGDEPWRRETVELIVRWVEIAFEEQRARAETMKALQTLEAGFDNLPDGISLADADLNMVAINKRFLELLDFPSDKFRRGDPFEKFIRYNAERGEYGPGDPNEQVRERIELAKRFEPHCFERARPDGRILQIRGTPLAGGGFVTTYSDISDRVRSERALRAAKETAEFANRTKSQFLATMSHELRTPLNAVIGFSEILTQEMFGPLGNPSYHGYAEDIHRSGIHLLKIINDILDVSKAEAGRIQLKEEELDLAEVVSTALRLTTAHAQEKGIKIRPELPATPIIISADELRLRQVLLNLMSNAVKFTNEGSVTVRAQADSTSGLALKIIDTGIGIAARDLERIFEPFAQAEATLSRSYEGTGLGLPLSRKLIELHGGTLTIESVPGEGSTSVIWLPPERVLSAAEVEVA